MAAEVDLPNGEAKDVVSDVDWWNAEASTVLARRVAETVFAKGFCVINMTSPQAEEDGSLALEAANERLDWTFPHPEFEVAYVGYGPKSKVVWLEGAGRPDAAHDPLQHYTQEVRSLGAILLPEVLEVLRFKPGAHISGTMLRTPFTGREQLELSQELLSEAEIRNGAVEKHLDFVQRRRLCMLYVIETKGGVIGLYPREDMGEQALTIPISKGKLLVFRHDLMGFSYEANSEDDLVLQSWFMEEPQQLSLGSLEGDQASLEDIFGGPPQASEEQVHIMAAMCHFPGKSSTIEAFATTILYQTDGCIKIPFLRWDMDAYYAAESGQFATGGKSVQKHCGLVEDRLLMSFDNNFFNISKATALCIAPCQRMLLETSFDLFTRAGFTRKSLEGTAMCNCLADIGLDWDQFHGIADPNGWLKSGATGHSVGSLNRVCYIFGLRGSCFQVDTACSSSMVAATICHTELRTREVRLGHVMGHCNILTPWPFIGLSAAGMIGRAGRCLTFNETANGFARGEGVGGLFMKVSPDIQVTQDRLGCFVSGYTNQDGRSASLTAPNGPSQQLCIRGSMRQAGLVPDHFSASENHGTGTALGDPIESGSVARVFQDHPTQLAVMSVKTLMCHLEGTSGSVSLLKVLAVLLCSAIPPNCHLRVLNAHMMDDVFPGIYPDQLGDNHNEHAMIGINSFGFGGTNSRGELWSPGRQLRNPREIVRRGVQGLRIDMLGPTSHLPLELKRLDAVTVACARCLGPMCWLCGAAIQQGSGKHHCRAIRDEFASYDYCSDCYQGGCLSGLALCGSAQMRGGYQFGTAAGEALEEGGCWGHQQDVCLVGTGSAWSQFVEMQERKPGVYVGQLALGELGVEEFHIVVGRDRSRAFRPVVRRAKQSARVVGPGRGEQGHNWLIDGRRDGVPAGAVYEVVFEWGDLHRSVMWKPTEKVLLMEEVRTSYQHMYSIARTSNGWALEDMQRSTDNPAVWEWQGQVLARSQEEFHFVRDRDRTQTIYPLEARADDPSVPVMGPDAGGQGHGWLAQGRPGCIVTVQLCVENRDIIVRVVASHPGEPASKRTWQSAAGGARDVYFIQGSWDKSDLTRMVADAEAPDVHRCRLFIGPMWHEEFHVVVNKSTNLRLHPANACAAPGESLVCGPDENPDGLGWEVRGPAGTEVEVVLDLLAEDNYTMLQCIPCEVALEAGEQEA